ncbi:unnamed protein product [Adineta ricciae]|uniref:SAP30-binding protein n=1 Tax=Adineta ricciae TaxID=249248 RepID=A0A814G2T7_ADIRI|nr:unnamed protein product [Adineta ricciae]
MSDKEMATSNSMDVDSVPAKSTPSPSVPSSSAVLDIGIGSGYISGSDDEEMTEPTTSQSSTPDSTTLPPTAKKKPLTAGKHPLTKTKSSLVNYERDSDDDEHTDDEDDDENGHSNEEQDLDDDQSNSNHAIPSHGEESDLLQMESSTYAEQTIVTSDLLNVTPFKGDDASPSRSDLQSNYAFVFPEDAEIRIPPEPTKNCSTRLQAKFEDYYDRYIKTGIDQNAVIQRLKDFRNPCMYEKMISHLDIDEIGTNFPQELYDPHLWGKESYYEELSKTQRLEMDRREKERRDRAKIGFTPGVKKIDQLSIGSTNNSDLGGEKRRSRFDQ